MHNFNRTRKPTELESLINLSVIEEYTDSICYSNWIPVSSLIGNIVLGNVGTVPIGEFPDAITTTGYYSFKKPTKWQNGVVGINIHYTGTAPVGDESTVVSYSISTIEKLEAIPAAPFGSTVSLVPTNTNVYYIYEGTNVSIGDLTEVNENDRAVAIGIKRVGANGGDTYTNTLKIIGIDVIYKEIRKQSTNKLDFNDRTK